MSKEITTPQIAGILGGFAVIGLIIGRTMKVLLKDDASPPELTNGQDEQNNDTPPPPPPPEFSLTDYSLDNDFAFSIFLDVARTREGNLGFSPYSADNALSSVALGAQGVTQEEITNALNLTTQSEERIKETRLLFQEHLEEVSPSGEVLSSNALLLPKGSVLNSDYRDLSTSYFSTLIRVIPEMGEEVNQWAQDTTNNNITQIVNNGPISALIESYLLSTFVFTLPWDHNSYQQKLQTQNFSSPDEDIETEFVLLKGELFYGASEEATIVTLDHDDDNFSAHIIIPEDETDDFYHNFDYDLFYDLKTKRITETAVLHLPVINFQETLQLENPLRNRNINKVFNPSVADLYKMVDFYEDDERNPYIGVFLQKTKVQIPTPTEENTFHIEDNTPTIKADKPFLIILEEKATNSILFLGRVVNPEK